MCSMYTLWHGMFICGTARKNATCAFDDAVKLKYINLNDIVQFNDFMMHIKREIDSLFLFRVLHFIL